MTVLDLVEPAPEGAPEPMTPPIVQRRRRRVARQCGKTGRLVIAAARCRAPRSNQWATSARMGHVISTAKPRKNSAILSACGGGTRSVRIEKTSQPCDTAG